MILGAYFDCSRNAVMKTDEIKKYVDILSVLGYKELYLYTEDTYQLPDEPYFGRFRSRYTESDYKELDDYCFTHGIELIPAVQVLGHMGTAYRWWHNIDKFDFQDILLVGEEKTYAFLNKVFGYFKSILRTDKIHIGMDEAHNVGKGKYLDKNGYEKPYIILRKHLARVSELLKKYGYTGLMWSDLFFGFANKGRYSTDGLNEELFNEAVSDIPENIEVVYWEYYSHDIAVYDAMLDIHKKYFGKINFAGGACCWQGFAPHNEMSLNVSRTALQSCLDRNTDRAIVTLWGDGGGQCSFYSVLPCVVAWSEYAKGNFVLEGIKCRFAEVIGESFDNFLLLDIPNRAAEERIYEENRNSQKPLNPSLYMLYSDYFAGAFDCYVKEGDGRVYAEYAKALAAKADNEKYGYIFDALSKLCSVLELKYDIGVRTRKCYQSGDKEGLKSLCDNEYALLPERISEFLVAYQTMWEKENKSSGIEVECIRLGGLIERTKNCKRLLEKYIADGSEIFELSEPIIDYYGQDRPCAPVLCNKYLCAATSNVISHEMIYR